MRTFLVCARALARAQHPIATCGAERRTEWSSGVGSSLLHRLPPHELQVFLACAVGEDLSPLCIQPLRARARLPVRLPCATMQCTRSRVLCSPAACSGGRALSSRECLGLTWVIPLPLQEGESSNDTRKLVFDGLEPRGFDEYLFFFFPLLLALLPQHPARLAF